MALVTSDVIQTWIHKFVLYGFYYDCLIKGRNFGCLGTFKLDFNPLSNDMTAKTTTFIL